MVKRRLKKSPRPHAHLLSSVALVHSGRPFFNALHYLIHAAKHEIQLQTYIFDDDQTGMPVLEALAAAVQRGVKVYVLVDGYASAPIAHETVAMMRQTGVQFRFFEPLFKSSNFFLGRRLHRKIAVADGLLALVGGINISDKYNDTPDAAAWKDYAVLLGGAAAAELQRICRISWRKKIRFEHFERLKPAFPDFIPEILSNQAVRIRQNDWIKKRREISKSYLELLRDARQQVTIMCSYFLPGRSIRKQLERTTRRGVKVRIILTHFSDVPIVKRAERFLYDWMLRRGIEIYEYEPSVVHAKVGVCDDQWVTIGSYNINNLSAFASLELNVDVFSQKFAQQLNHELQDIMKRHCMHITPEKYRLETGITTLFINWCCYQLIRLSMAIATFRIRIRR